MTPSKFRIAILISGRGSNMQAILEQLQNHPNALFALVLSDTAKAQGLTSAQYFGLSTAVVDKQSSTAEDFQNNLLATLKAYRINLLVLAGFMSILKTPVLDYLPNRIINIHPSLLPQYPGLNTHQRALDDGCTEVGASVHLVDHGIDSGPILRQVRIDIKPNDTAARLAQRLLPLEHQLYCAVLQDIFDYKLSLDRL